MRNQRVEKRIRDGALGEVGGFSLPVFLGSSVCLMDERMGVCVCVGNKKTFLNRAGISFR